MITRATFVTLIRILLTPLVAIAIAHRLWECALFLFVAACVTDFFDGFLARRYREESLLGAYLDPFADKCLLVGSFFALCFIACPIPIIPTWFFWLILIKELLLVAGAILLWLCKSPYVVRPNLLGKINTMLQMLFVIAVLGFSNGSFLYFYQSAIQAMTMMMIVCLASYSYSAARPLLVLIRKGFV